MTSLAPIIQRTELAIEENLCHYVCEHLPDRTLCGLTLPPGIDYCEGECGRDDCIVCDDLHDLAICPVCGLLDCEFV